MPTVLTGSCMAAIDSPQNIGARRRVPAFDRQTASYLAEDIRGYGQAGSVVTASGLVFVGPAAMSLDISSLNAKTGDLLWKFNTDRAFSPPAATVNGEEFVTVA